MVKSITKSIAPSHELITDFENVWRIRELNGCNSQVITHDTKKIIRGINNKKLFIRGKMKRLINRYLDLKQSGVNN